MTVTMTYRGTCSDIDGDTDRDRERRRDRDRDSDIVTDRGKVWGKVQ